MTIEAAPPIQPTAAPQSRPRLLSISVIKITADRVLFVGDSRAATVYAFELGPAAPANGSTPYNLRGIDAKIARLLGVDVEDIAVRDLAIDPLSHEAYVAVHRGHAPDVIPAIVRLKQDGSVAPVDLFALPFTKLVLDPALQHSEDVLLQNGVAARTLSITDLAFSSGELLIAGLTSADFSSTLYRAAYPFGDAVSVSSIEMFHAVHNQNETRAPIRTMTTLSLGGQPHVLAVYTCTPLVTIPCSALQSGAHVKGKTIGELGYGNTPLDVVRFQTEERGQAQEYVLITHRNRGPMLFSAQSLADGNAKDGLSTPVGFSVVAPAFTTVGMNGVLQIDDQDAQLLAGLRRDPETGRLDLLSFRKGIFFRISDHISEYMMPGYEYPPDQARTQKFQESRWSEELPDR